MNLNLHRSVRASYAVLSWIFQYESPVFYRYTQKPLGSVYTKKIEVTHIWIFSGITILYHGIKEYSGQQNQWPFSH